MHKRNHNNPFPYIWLVRARRIHQSVLIRSSAAQIGGKQKHTKSALSASFSHLAYDPLEKRDLRPPIVLMEPFWRRRRRRSPNEKG